MHQLRNESKWPLARKEQEYLTFQLHLQAGFSLFIDSSDNKSTKASREERLRYSDIWTETFVRFFKAPSLHAKRTSRWNLPPPPWDPKLFFCVRFNCNNVVCQATSFKIQRISAPFASSLKGRQERRWGVGLYITGDSVLRGGITLSNWWGARKCFLILSRAVASKVENRKKRQH